MFKKIISKIKSGFKSAIGKVAEFLWDITFGIEERELDKANEKARKSLESSEEQSNKTSDAQVMELTDEEWLEVVSRSVGLSPEDWHFADPSRIFKYERVQTWVEDNESDIIAEVLGERNNGNY